jgi:hypothetical protein
MAAMNVIAQNGRDLVAARVRRAGWVDVLDYHAF